jgi:hypothetical protein
MRAKKSMLIRQDNSRSVLRLIPGQMATSRHMNTYICIHTYACTWLKVRSQGSLKFKILN